ncbi:UDP-glycosyltransferase 75C1-like [Impatiens glandulifera]|uniref:UDP-glycosyltransferase 75C1-like n=1 Tax=Impatiens glandulifera TaxID=253017 RepID=UPI001FB070CF|nr:UDP-glycosyltransferase 75C1-like [Impatiens glandulifera]
MAMNVHRRILLVCFPGQGHINPTLQFAKHLHRQGLNITFLTAFSALNRMSPPSLPLQGLDFVGFSTDFDSTAAVNKTFDFNHYMSQIRHHGSKKLSQLLSTAIEELRPFSQVIYAILLPWAAIVARDLNVPSTLLWIQPAAIFNIYYHYFNGYEDEFKRVSRSSGSSVLLPGLPELCKDDLPSFTVANNGYGFVLEFVREHIQFLESEQDPYPKILINTCEILESEALKAITRFNLIPIGPMILSDKSFGGDMLIENSRDYMDWLDSKPEGSVVYVSFGSYLPLSMQQIKEIGKGLLISGRPFLWVIRDNQKDESFMSCDDEFEKMGKIVGWCSQIEVLSHKSVGCFVSHCGWNSCLESLVCGVPIVGFPHWSDQTTNAKMIKDLWRVGVRVEKGDDDGIVNGDELKTCIEMVMKDGENEIRKNADKWRVMIQEAGKHGGSSSHQRDDFSFGSYLPLSGALGDRIGKVDDILKIDNLVLTCRRRFDHNFLSATLSAFMAFSSDISIDQFGIQTLFDSAVTKGYHLLFVGFRLLNEMLFLGLSRRDAI